MNDQFVTPVNSIRSAVLASLLSKGEARAIACVQRARSETRLDENRRMVGDGMIGSSSDVNQGTTAGGPRAGRGQSPRRSEEAGNDRGAKGGRDAVWDVSEDPSPKGPGRAARLCARMRRESGPGESWRTDRGPPAQQVSGAQAGAAGATLPNALSRVPEPVHRRRPRTGKLDAGKPPVQFGWGATVLSVLYPHHGKYRITESGWGFDSQSFGGEMLMRQECPEIKRKG